MINEQHPSGAVDKNDINRKPHRKGMNRITGGKQQARSERCFAVTEPSPKTREKTAGTLNIKVCLTASNHEPGESIFSFECRTGKLEI